MTRPAEQRAATLAAAATTNCWYDYTRTGKNLLGGTLFTFTTHTAWCGGGDYVRNYAYTTATGKAHLTWAYFGLEQNYDEGGVNWTRFRSVRQGQFCLGNCIIQSKSFTADTLVGPAGQVFRA